MSVLVAVVAIPSIIDGIVAKALFKVRLLNVVEVVPLIVWAAVPLRVTV